MYLYESHMGGIYLTEEEMPDESLRCDVCHDYDWFLGNVNSARESLEFLADRIDIDGSGGFVLDDVMQVLKIHFDDCPSKQEAESIIRNKIRKTEFLYGEHTKFLSDEQDILGDDYDLGRLREIVSIFKDIPHTCNYCVGCEMEPKDGHGCDEYDSFVLSIRRLRELIEADRDGRCVLLPCKVGERIYKVMPRYLTTYGCDYCLNMYGMGRVCEYYDENSRDCKNIIRQGSEYGIVSKHFSLEMLYDFGKTVFLKPEEAEAALRRIQDG